MQKRILLIVSIIYITIYILVLALLLYLMNKYHYNFHFGIFLNLIIYFGILLFFRELSHIYRFRIIYAFIIIFILYIVNFRIILPVQIEQNTGVFNIYFFQGFILITIFTVYHFLPLLFSNTFFYYSTDQVCYFFLLLYTVFILHDNWNNEINIILIFPFIYFFLKFIIITIIDKRFLLQLIISLVLFGSLTLITFSFSASVIKPDPVEYSYPVVQKNNVYDIDENAIQLHPVVDKNEMYLFQAEFLIWDRDRSSRPLQLSTLPYIIRRTYSLFNEKECVFEFSPEKDIALDLTKQDLTRDPNTLIPLPQTPWLDIPANYRDDSYSISAIISFLPIQQQVQFNEKINFKVNYQGLLFAGFPVKYAFRTLSVSNDRMGSFPQIQTFSSISPFSLQPYLLKPKKDDTSEDSEKTDETESLKKYLLTDKILENHVILEHNRMRFGLEWIENFPNENSYFIENRVTGEAHETMYDVLELVYNFYRDEKFSFSLEPGIPQDNTTAVQYFLETSKEGYCSYFATGTAILLNRLGIKTRVVSGYIPHAIEVNSNLCVILASDAHAWNQIFIPDYGWVDIDLQPPTKDSDQGSVRESNRGMTQTPRTEKGNILDFRVQIEEYIKKDEVLIAYIDDYVLEELGLLNEDKLIYLDVAEAPLFPKLVFPNQENIDVNSVIENDYKDILGKYALCYPTTESFATAKNEIKTGLPVKFLQISIYPSQTKKQQESLLQTGKTILEKIWDIIKRILIILFYILGSLVILFVALCILFPAFLFTFLITLFKTAKEDDTGIRLYNFYIYLITINNLRKKGETSMMLAIRLAKEHGLDVRDFILKIVEYKYAGKELPEKNFLEVVYRRLIQWNKQKNRMIKRIINIYNFSKVYVFSKEFFF